ncbi:unnamed protein product, partial [Tilletia controversa]
MSGQPVLQDDNTSLVDEAGDDPLNLGNSDSGAPNETGQLDWAGCISALQISLRLRFPTPYLYLKWAFQAEAAKDKTHPAPTFYAGLKKLFAGVRRSPYALVRALRRFYALNTNLGPGISVIVVMVIAGINMDFSAILYTYAGLSLFDPTAREPQDASLQPRWMNYRIPQLDHMYWVHFGLTTAVVVLSWLWPYLPWSREWCAWILAWVYGETVQMNEETIENNSKKTDDAAGSQVQDGATTTAMNPNVTKAMKRGEYSKIEDKPRLEGHTYNHGQMQNIIDALGTKLETLKEEMLRTFDLTEDINRRQKRWEKRPKTLQTMFNSDIPETIRNFQVLWRTIKVDVPSASLTNVSVNYVVVLTQVAELYFLLFDYAPKKTEEALRFLEIAAGHQIRAVEVWPDAEQVKLFEASDFYLDTILKSRFDVPIPLGKNGDLSAATIFAHLKFLKKRLPHSYWFLAQPTPMIDTVHDSAWVDKVPITRIVTWRSEVEGESGTGKRGREQHADVEDDTPIGLLAKRPRPVLYSAYPAQAAAPPHPSHALPAAPTVIPPLQQHEDACMHTPRDAIATSGSEARTKGVATREGSGIVRSSDPCLKVKAELTRAARVAKTVSAPDDATWQAPP